MSSSHGKSSVWRWLKRTKKARSSDDETCSDVEIASRSMLSPPPLTETSASTEESSVVLTPQTTYNRLDSFTHSKGARARQTFDSAPVQASAPTPANRVRTPWTPAIGPIPLPTSPNPPPALRTHRRPAISLPPDSPRPVVSSANTTRRTIVTTQAVVIAKPVPLKAQPQVTIHAILAYESQKLKILYDLTLPSKFSKQYPDLPNVPALVKKPTKPPATYTPLPPISDDILRQPATRPPVARLKIIIEQLSGFEWEVLVKPLGKEPQSFIRVCDVLACLHTSLRTQVMSTEYEATPDIFRKQVKKAYRRRCALWQKFMACNDENNGVRRIDFLLDMTRFSGLERKDEGLANTVKREVTTWILKVDPYFD